MSMKSLAATLCAALALGAASSAVAADKPLYGPPPAWVDVAPIPATPEGLDQPYYGLLLDRQVKVQGDGPLFRCEIQALVEEVTAAEAEVANRRIRQVTADRVILRTTTQPTPQAPAPSS